MGEMGSSPHTIDKSPFFDPPIEVFFKYQDEQQDSVHSSLSIEEEIEDSMIPTGISEEVEDEVGVETIAQENKEDPSIEEKCYTKKSRLFRVSEKVSRIECVWEANTIHGQ